MDCQFTLLTSHGLYSCHTSNNMKFQAASRELHIPDATQGVTFSALLFYPTTSPAIATAFGPYVLEVARDAPPADGSFPLLVLSHGNGGSPLLYRDLATHLARGGYIVVAPKHPGNSVGDNALADAAANLVNRPRHVGLCLDAVLADPLLRSRVAPRAIGAIGHSMGAYSVLCAAGAQPWNRERTPIPVRHDERLRALVLLAPAGEFFGVPEGAVPGALDQVTQPLLILAAEQDPVTPNWQAKMLRDGVPDPARVQLRIVPGSGHFSFLGVFPPQMRRVDFAPSQDPPGFDREAFQRQLTVEVQSFLDAALAGLRSDPAQRGALRQRL